MGKQARAHVEKYFDRKGVVREYADTLHELTAK